MADWSSLTVQVPGKDALEGARGALETLVTFLEVVKAVLETVKVFLVDFGNPVKALVDALVKLILQLFELLKRTGLYGYFDFPDVLNDPQFKANFGGYQGFVNRFKASLYDVKDPNRPQPIAGATQGGFVLIVVDAADALAMLRSAKQLLRFFGRDLTAPQYAAPSNVRALPIGDKGDPILAVAKAFATQPKGIAIEWSLPDNPQPPDPGFNDLVTSVALDFIPPKFLIERADVPVTGEVEMKDVNDKNAAGVVVATYETDFELRGKPGARIKRKEKVTDEYGDPFVKFLGYTVIDSSTETSAFLVGQLGKFRFIDTNVDFDKVYYYRVRAFSGDLDVDANGRVNFAVPASKDVNSNTWVLPWPSKDPSKPVIMGRASGTMRVRLPKIPANFDVVEVLQRLFQAAFSLNFHTLPSADATFNSSKQPTGTTLNSEVGKGSLVRQGGVLSDLVNVPLIGLAARELTASRAFKNEYAPDEATGKYPEMPWQNKLLRRQSARLANTVASALLQAGSGTIDGFRMIMQTSPLPKGAPAASSTALSGVNTIEKLVTAMTKVNDDGTVDRDTAVLYGDVFADVNVRLNILHAIEFIASFTLQGTPPDWVQISILRDVIPWGGQFLYDLSAKINAMLDAYRGTMAEINDFISLIERKIDTLERFLQYLISLLDFIEGLSFGAYILTVSSNGDVQDWVQAVDSAGGTQPSSGPTGYSAGTALAFVGADVGPIVDALKAIF